MTDQPLTAGGLRGAIDLTALRSQPPAAAPAAPSGQAGGSGIAGRAGVVVEGTDTNFQEVANASVGVPMLLVLWAAQIPESRDYLDTVVRLAAGYDGRFQVVSVNVEQNPTLLRAFQVQSVPVTMGLIQGQPVPMFAGIQPEQALRPVLDEFLGLAVQHGVTGRVDLAGAEPVEAGDVEEQLPPLHQEAYDAIERGDLDGAAAAYEKALKQNPADADAELGLAQVGLMQRTEGADLQAARAAAAEHPLDVAAQGLVADLDLLGGHVEDAFLRLIDLVRATAGEEREQAKNHLLQLFAVVGSHDERVRKARTSLMSALF
ncbi:putative thioredoxin [Phycicoccus badiiscoriae]|uniref:Putative thioredoxin n=1 Tax=Pedococcus badiiscoriae TaxID=642776 RepID=A0A852WJQ1_9MICO|nr:tetratricopeptide repeat protein [Pedococcus badiiscoriae]NYG07841.1 putative thioredoxin [Pedococcus badiiscoriae]